MSRTDWLDDQVESHPRRISVIDASSSRQYSYQSLNNRANQIAQFCEHWVGLVPGDWIGLLSAPSDDGLQIIVAAGKLGLAALRLDPSASPESLIAAINRHGPRTVFYGLAQAELVQEIWFEVDSVEHFIPLRGAVDTANFEDIVAHYPPLPPLAQGEEDTPWVHFAAEGITWSSPDAVPDDGPGGVEAPLYRPEGLAAAISALRKGQAVVVEREAVRIIESPAEKESVEEHEVFSQRNVPRGRSWLPHEFL
jgi:acyl-CoA synthetase (AMP-forming)/AMP-acid ligase II